MKIVVEGFNADSAYVRVDFGDGQFVNCGGLMTWDGASDDAIRINRLTGCDVVFDGYIPDHKPPHIWAFMQEITR